MAEQRAQDVVNQTLSVGDLSPSDAPETTSTPEIKLSGDDVAVVEVVSKENGIHMPFRMDEIDDASGRSDTDTSRAEGSVAGDKPTEHKPLKKFVAKPVSFAKYSVPKVIAASATAKGTDKGISHCSHYGDTTDPEISYTSEFPVFFYSSRWPSSSRCKDHKFSSIKGQTIQNCYTRSHAGLEQEPRYIPPKPVYTGSDMLTICTSYTPALNETFDR